MTRNLAIWNFLSVILTIIVSYFSQAVRLNKNTIGSVSDQYENLFTPAGYAFSIWGLIFIALLAYSIYQIHCAFSDADSEIVDRTGPWFILANLANTAWVVAWLYEETWLSVILMFVILFSLIMIIWRTKMELWDAPLKVIAFAWWPICFYAGWITVAAIANVAAYLTKIGWKGWILSEEVWTIIMLAVAVIINLLIVYRRNMREFALIGVWGLVAIYVRHVDESEMISYTALAGAAVIFGYISYHGYVNRKTNPMYSLVNQKSEAG